MNKWAEVIVWREYPKWKPETTNDVFSSKEYLVKIKSSETNIESVTTLYYLHFPNSSNDKHTPKDCFSGDYIDFKVWKVIAFAELPTGEIGDEFWFETADYYMKHGTYCIGVTGIPKKYDGLGGVECVKDYACWHEETLTIDEIQGKWRLA